MKYIYQLKIQVKNLKPSTYRTILVHEDIMFFTLHEYIQSVFGLMNYHMWQFSGKPANPFAVIPEFTIAPKYEHEYEMPNYYAEKTKVNDILQVEKQKLEYWYDFGDDWKFSVTLQKKFPKTELNPKIQKIPMVYKSKGPMLMEDVHGYLGMADILELHDVLLSGKNISKKSFEQWEETIANVVGWDRLEEDQEGWEQDYIEMINDLYEVDWKNFDIEDEMVAF